MNDLIVKGNWNQVKGILKKKYGELTEEDLTQLEGQKDQMLGVLQERTGKSKEELKGEIEEELDKL